MNLATCAAAPVAIAEQLIKSQAKQIVGKSVKRQPQPRFAHNLQTRSICVCVCVCVWSIIYISCPIRNSHTHTCTITAIQWTSACPLVSGTPCACVCICVLLVGGRTMPKVYILVCVCVCVCMQATIKTHTHVELLTLTQRVVDKLEQTRAKKPRDLSKYEFWRDDFSSASATWACVEEQGSRGRGVVGEWVAVSCNWSNRNCFYLPSLRCRHNTLCIIFVLKENAIVCHRWYPLTYIDCKLVLSIVAITKIKADHDGTRTRNLRIRSPTPSPLGHTVQLSLSTLN